MSWPEADKHVPIKLLKYYRCVQDKDGIHDVIKDVEESDWYHAGTSMFPGFKGPYQVFGLCDRYGNMTHMTYQVEGKYGLKSFTSIMERDPMVFYFDAGSVKYKVICTTMDELERVWRELELPL